MNHINLKKMNLWNAFISYPQNLIFKATNKPILEVMAINNKLTSLNIVSTT